MALASNPTIAVISCPGHYDAHEGSLTGPDTIAFLGAIEHIAKDALSLKVEYGQSVAAAQKVYAEQQRS